MNDIDSLIIYAERYAINRMSYASGDMARIVYQYTAAGTLSRKTRIVLGRDIKKALEDKVMHFDDQIRDWKQALNAIEASLENGL